MYVVYDLETTGFKSVSDDIIEFAYIMFDDNGLYLRSEQLYFYYKGMSWSEEAYAVHKIPLSFLETQADKFQENIIKMYTVLAYNTVVGYNNDSFDNPFAKNWLARQGLPNLTIGRSVDMMKVCKPLHGKARIKLTTLCEKLGYTPDVINQVNSFYFNTNDTSRAHEAGYDVTATAMLVNYCLNKNMLTFKALNNSASDSTYVDNNAVMLSGNTCTVSLQYGESVETKTVSVGVIPTVETNKILLHPVDDMTFACDSNGVSLIYDTNAPDDLFYVTMGVKTPLSSVTDLNAINSIFKLFIKEE